MKKKDVLKELFNNAQLNDGALFNVRGGTSIYGKRTQHKGEGGYMVYDQGPMTN